MRTPPPSSITLCQPPTSYSGGRAFPKSYLKSRKPDPDGADLLVMDVDAFRPDFDVIDELTNNRDKYIAKSGESINLSILNFPEVCRMNIDRLRARAEEVVTKPGKHPAISACFKCSVDRLNNHDVFVRLQNHKHRFDLGADTTNGDVASLMYSFLTTHFKIDLPGGGGRQNVNVPEHIHTGLSSLASELGADIQDLAVMCVFIALVEQPDTNKDHADQMQMYIDRFVSRAEIRTRGVEALMKAFGLTTEGEESK